LSPKRWGAAKVNIFYTKLFLQVIFSGRSQKVKHPAENQGINVPKQAETQQHTGPLTVQIVSRSHPFWILYQFSQSPASG
jgi:hypothetical protein